MQGVQEFRESSVHVIALCLVFGNLHFTSNFNNCRFRVYKHLCFGVASRIFNGHSFCRSKSYSQHTGSYVPSMEALRDLQYIQIEMHYSLSV